MALPRFWRKGKWLLLFVVVVVLLTVAHNTGIERTRLTFLEVWIRDMLAPLESGATVVLSGTKTLTGYFTG
jgi:rod shape-determining protein MreC